MKILFLTQRVDLNDDLLGFVHGWLERLAARVEKVSVVALGVGEYRLPQNVRVFSLGKEKIVYHSLRKIKYLAGFFKYLWVLRQDYDLVFVHMNKEYVILGGLFWWLMSKKIILWYNHRAGNSWTRLACALADKIFYTSNFSFVAKLKKAEIMPAGIDTVLFRKNESVVKIPRSILYLGRISPIKNVETLVEAAKILDQKDVDFVLNILGGTSARDERYFEKLKSTASAISPAKVNFLPEVPNYQAPGVFNKNEIVVNLTNSGSLDKSLLEAMACENAVILSNLFFKDSLPRNLLFEERNARDLSEKLVNVLNLSASEKGEMGKKLRVYVLENQSLDALVEKLIKNFKELLHE